MSVRSQLCSLPIEIRKPSLSSHLLVTGALRVWPAFPKLSVPQMATSLQEFLLPNPFLWRSGHAHLANLTVGTFRETNLTVLHAMLNFDFVKLILYLNSFVYNIPDSRHFCPPLSSAFKPLRFTLVKL